MLVVINALATAWFRFEVRSSFKYLWALRFILDYGSFHMVVPVVRSYKHSNLAFLPLNIPHDGKVRP